MVHTHTRRFRLLQTVPQRIGGYRRCSAVCPDRDLPASWLADYRAAAGRGSATSAAWNTHRCSGICLTRPGRANKLRLTALLREPDGIPISAAYGRFGILARMRRWPAAGSVWVRRRTGKVSAPEPLRRPQPAARLWLPLCRTAQPPVRGPRIPLPGSHRSSVLGRDPARVTVVSSNRAR